MLHPAALRFVGAVGLVCALWLPSLPAGAAYYWGHSTLSNTPSVCFVGDALANAPDRVDEILEYISEFERVANIRFNYLGNCPDPILGRDSAYYPGDIRVYIPASGLPWDEAVPGINCPIGFVNSSFGREPDFLAGDRGCLYNFKLGDDADEFGVPWRNHTLHEFGHALGLAHEHQRPDALNPSTCAPMATSCPIPSVPGISDLLCMTPYDPDSVMNYENLTCGIHGNYSHSGLSAWDRLGLHILYPEAQQVAEMEGTRVLRLSQDFALWSSWYLRGAIMPAVARNLAWRVDNVTQSTTTSFSGPVGLGVHEFQFSHQDFLGRTYTRTTKLRVYSDDDFTRNVMAAITVVPEPRTDLLHLTTALALCACARYRRYRST